MLHPYLPFALPRPTSLFLILGPERLTFVENIKSSGWVWLVWDSSRRSKGDWSVRLCRWFLWLPPTGLALSLSKSLWLPQKAHSTQLCLCAPCPPAAGLGVMQWAEWQPPNDIQILFPRSEMLTYLGKGSADVINLRILRSGDNFGLSKWTLNPITYPHKREAEGVWQTEERRQCDHRGRTGATWPQVEDCHSQQSLEETKTELPENIRRESPTSSPQNHERKHFCHFKTPVCSHLLQ